MTSVELSSWRDFTLEEIARIEGGGTPSRQNGTFFGGDIPWVTPSDLPPIGRLTTLGRVAGSITVAGLANSSAKLVPAGSVLFSSRASIGKIAITDRICATNQGFTNFLPDQNLVDSWFLGYLLAYHRTDFVRLAGQTTFLEVSRGKLRNFRVRIPALDEQRRIVARIRECMERVDEIDRLREQTSDEIIRLRNAIPDEIGRAGDWPLEAVGDVIIDTRNGRSVRTQSEDENGFVLSLSAVHDVDLDIESRKPTILSDSLVRQFGIQKGDIFISRANTSELVGLPSIVTETPKVPTIYPDLLIKLDPNQSIIRPRYLVYALRTFSARELIRDRAIGSSQSMVKISGGRLRDVKIPLPPLDQQDLLINRLDQLVIAAKELRAGTMCQPEIALRRAILRSAFAGE
jgi:type I restriction enzyme S subunit